MEALSGIEITTGEIGPKIRLILCLRFSKPEKDLLLLFNIIEIM